MVNITVVDEILTGLEILEFYPSDPAKRLLILGEVCEMAHEDDQVRWLVRRARRVFGGRWPGSEELRACFCHRYKPRDGVEAVSAIYPDGFPPDPEVPPRKQIGPAPRAQIASGETVTELLDISKLPVTPMLPLRPARPLKGETDLQGLLRAVDEAKQAPVKKPPRPTQEEIEAIKRRQAEAAREETTRQILAGSGKPDSDDEITGVS